MGQSVNEYNEFFEGCEKCLDMVIKFNTTDKHLRSVSRADLDSLMEEVGASIISKMSCEYIDAYVLSESSLFLWADRIILKTCGTTVPLLVLNKLFSILESKIGQFEVQRVIYSRKCFADPSKQIYPHRNQEEEVVYLREFFQNGVFNLFNRDSEAEWMLFIYDNPSPYSHMFANSNLVGMQVMMWNLDKQTSSVFYTKDGDTFKSITEKCQIDRIIPGSSLDGFLFDPCGYSMNGLKEDRFQTIHVTPQESCSYASYECSLSENEIEDVLHKVLRVFRPSKVIVALFCVSLSVQIPKIFRIKQTLKQVSNDCSKFRGGNVAVYSYSDS